MSKEDTNDSISKNKKINIIEIIIIVFIILLFGIFVYEFLINKFGNKIGENKPSKIEINISNSNSNIVENSEILGEMPQNFSKILYMKVNTDIMDLINSEMGSIGSSSVKEFAAFELNNNITSLKFMLVKVDNNFDPNKKGTDNNFDINKAIDIGLGNIGANYVHKDLGNNILIYGIEESIQYFENYTGEKLKQVDNLKDSIKDITDNKYNFALFTKPDLNGTQFGNIKRYIENLEYATVILNLSKQRVNGKVLALFNQNLQFGQNYKFFSKLGNYQNNSSVFFMEAGNLLPIFNLNRENIISLMDNYIKQTPYAALFTTGDYQKIVNTVEGNIALNITEAANPYGFGVSVIFEKGDIFDVAKKILPFLKIGQTQAKSQSGIQMNFIEEDSKVGVVSKLSFPIGKINTEISILKYNNNQAVFQILGPDINSGGNIKLNSTEKTVLNFLFDFNKISKLLKKDFSDPRLLMIENAIGPYKNTKIYGNIALERNEVLLTFDTQQ